MAIDPKLRLSHQIYVRATPAELWDVLTNPAKTPAYAYGTAVKSDFRSGSPIRYVGPDGGSAIDGEILEAEPAVRLVHTWRALYDAASAADRPSRVAWAIAPLGERVSQLTVVHDDFEGETKTYCDSVEGWPLLLSALKTLAETGEPLPIPMGG